MWLLFALGSSIFAALTSILAKLGIEGVNSTLATAIRTVVVLVMSWGMVFLAEFGKFTVEYAKGHGNDSVGQGKVGTALDHRGTSVKNFVKYTGNDAGKALVAAGPKV